jgi:ABC-2 type transport system ATP-binding protein
MEYAIETICLNKKFGDREIVRNLNLTVKPGCILGFLGPNGAGKTTTVSMLAGALLPTSGEIRLLGERMTPSQSHLKRQIGVVHDRLGLFEQLSGFEHISLLGRMYGLETAQAEKRTAELLEFFALEAAARQPVSEYSHGMRKRIAFACALVHGPKILILDEPFEGMDAAGARMIIDNLTMSASSGAAVLITSHVIAHIERVCDEVAILDSGALVYRGTCQAKADGDISGLEELYLSATNNDHTEKRILPWILK